MGCLIGSRGLREEGVFDFAFDINGLVENLAGATGFGYSFTYDFGGLTDLYFS